MNKKHNYTDRKIATETQNYYLKIAGFVIKLVLEPTEQVVFKRNTINLIQEIWGKGGFLKKTSSIKPDFEIKFTSYAVDMNIIERDGGKDHYYKVVRRDFSSRKAYVYHFTSLPVLTILLKEILSFLARKDGFLLHASSCQNKKGHIKLFLASSGGGKTTTANMLSKSSAWSKFSDDVVIVRKIRGEWNFFGAAFVEKDRLPINEKAKSAKLYLIKKSKSASMEPMINKGDILKAIINQIWVNSGKLEAEVLASAMSFVAENKFYILRATLNRKDMQQLFNEN